MATSAARSRPESRSPRESVARRRKPSPTVSAGSGTARVSAHASASNVNVSAGLSASLWAAGAINNATVAAGGGTSDEPITASISSLASLTTVTATAPDNVSLYSGGAMSNELGGIRFRGTKVDISQFYLALDPKCFLAPGEYEDRATKLTGILKAVQPATGYDEVLVAGEPELRKEAERRKQGIPLADDTWQSLTQWAAKLNIPLISP